MSTSVPADLSALRVVKLPSFRNENGNLGIAEAGASVPFAIARIFYITDMPIGAVRGQHAHRRCSQFLLCLSGAMSIFCDDGTDEKSFRLDRQDRAILVPPGIWLQIRNEIEHSVLLVLCDRPYEEDDYVRDRAEFEAWRALR